MGTDSIKGRTVYVLLYEGDAEVGRIVCGVYESKEDAKSELKSQFKDEVQRNVDGGFPPEHTFIDDDSASLEVCCQIQAWDIEEYRVM